MVAVDAATAVRVLEQNTYRHLGELISLKGEGAGNDVRVFGEALEPAFIMLVEAMPYGPWVALSGCDAAFAQECVAWWRQELERFRIGSLEPGIFVDPGFSAAFASGGVQCTRSFVCTSLDAVPAHSSQVVVLAAADADAVARYPVDVDARGPGLAQFHQWFTVGGGGEIIAVRIGDEIIGYLAATPEYGNIWDVVLIHVREEYRGHGLGMSLAAAYARTRLERGQIPYYSGARNEASERAATKAGFHCCRQLYWTDVERRAAGGKTP